MSDSTGDFDKTDWFGAEIATFGDRLVAAREQADMTQGDLAQRLGVSKATLAAWEHDSSEPRVNRLSMMAGLLNVSLSWLLTGEGGGVRPPAPEAESTPAEIHTLLAELANLRAQLAEASDRLGTIEQSLRRIALAGRSV
ncbi:MAG: helix-turn-helix domain-containing protein [Rhodobacteraceae bacterium]|nr:helix-turn-helix domain-containing protein [Paracoccaceae bacterium]